MSEMYYAQYKCQLCGAVVRYGDVKPVACSQEQLQELCMRVIRNQQFMNNPALYQAPVNAPHHCADGSCGMAYFAGFKRV